jgi:hypothetical protein
VGAVALRSALYVLPNTIEAREDFDWIRTEIVDRGGRANILAADAVDGYTNNELEASFRSARTADYESLIQDADRLRKRIGAQKLRPARAIVKRDLGRLRDRLNVIAARDFFGAAGATGAKEALRRLEDSLHPTSVAKTSTVPVDPRSLRGRVWVTRPRPGIDRMASAWLIRRFLAPAAKFAFASTPTSNQIPFDMSDVEFGHHGDDCTFETLLRRFAIGDPAAHRVGQLVHDLDLKDARYGMADGPTIGRLVEGIRQSAGSDHERLERGIAMIEALYQSFATEALQDTIRHPSRRRSARRTPRS